MDADKSGNVQLVAEPNWHDKYKRYGVLLDGERIGFVEQVQYVCETRSKGRRYVNSRWTSKRPRWKAGLGDRFHADGANYETRKWAVESLIRRHETALAQRADA